jgi:MFS superfamily sulfate permease-like transporter
MAQGIDSPLRGFVTAVAFRIIWRSVSEIFGVVSDLVYDLRPTGA